MGRFFDAPAPRLWTPDELLINGANLKASATTKYVSPILPVAGYSEFMLTLVETIVGATTVGTVKFTFDVYANETLKLITAFDVVTAIIYTVTGTTNLSFGGPKGNLVKGTGTIATAPATDILRAMSLLQVTLEVVTASDAATSALGSVWLSAR